MLETRRLQLVVGVVNLLGMVVADPQVPCFFIIGDSLADAGNNNLLATTSRANYPPYGVDFLGGYGSGRFCNGRTTVDFLGEFLGFDRFIPPSATAEGRDILSGVNYASGSAGIRDETGQHMGDRISLRKQVENFRGTVEHLKLYFGSDASVADYLSRCIFSVDIGNNDYINNYFLPQYYPTSRQYTPQQYAALLIQQYEEQLKILYNYRARKVAVTAVGYVGCIPRAVAPSNGTCNGTINGAVDLFNAKLPSLVDDLNKSLVDAKFIFVNSTAVSIDIAINAKAYGFTHTDAGCCTVDVEDGTGLCLSFEEPCTNRSKFVYWDDFHPTEAVNLINAKNIYSTSLSSLM